MIYLNDTQTENMMGEHKLIVYHQEKLGLDRSSFAKYCIEYGVCPSKKYRSKGFLKKYRQVINE